MQITIDLGEFWDQDPDVLGNEVLSRVADQVRERSVSPETYAEAQRMLKMALTEEIRQSVHEAVQDIIAFKLDDEFVMVSGYGETGKTTTLRKQIQEQVEGALAAITGGNRNSYPSDMQKRWRELIDNTVKQIVTEELKPFVAELRAKYEAGFQAALDSALLSIKAPRR